MRLLLLLLMVSCTNVKDQFKMPDNKILFSGMVNNINAEKFIKDLSNRYILRTKEVFITIDSVGGLTSSKNIFIEAIRSLRFQFEVKVKCLALEAMSHALDIFLECDEKLILKSSVLMQHQVYCVKGYTCNEFLINQENLYRNTKYMLLTKLSYDELMSKMGPNKNWFIDPKEAIKLNIADKIID